MVSMVYLKGHSPCGSIYPWMLNDIAHGYLNYRLGGTCYQEVAFEGLLKPFKTFSSDIGR